MTEEHDAQGQFPSVGDRVGRPNTTTLLREAFLKLGALIAAGAAEAGYPQRPSHPVVFAHIDTERSSRLTELAARSSRLKADKLLIKTRRVGQVGVEGGVQRKAHVPAFRVLESHLMRPASACRTAQSGHHQAHSVLVGGQLPGRMAEEGVAVGVDGDLFLVRHFPAPDPRSRTPAAPRAGSLPTPTLQRSPADRASFLAWTH